MDDKAEPQKYPSTHKCIHCGALWRYWRSGDAYEDSPASWSLVSMHAGPCCGNAAMGEQIQPMTVEDMVRYLFAVYAVDAMSRVLPSTGR